MAERKKAPGPEDKPGSPTLVGKHYSPKELSDLLGVTIQMLTYLRIKGIGPKYVKFGQRNLIYSAVEVDKYLKERERQSTSDSGIPFTRLDPYQTD